jgi:cytochrome c55X
MRKIILVTFLLVALLLVSACAAPQPTPTPSAIDANELYATNCASCHGENRQGVSGLGDALIPEHLADDSDIEIRDTILNGIPGTVMPGFEGRLSPDEINASLPVPSFAMYPGFVFLPFYDLAGLRILHRPKVRCT